jgi:hypothetical protein
MQSLLAEQPLILSLMLGVLAVCLIYGWLQTGKKELAAIGLTLAALIPVAWVIAANWVTDRERIEVLIYETADAIKNNDHERALNLIADTSIRDRARGELGNFVFDEARVTKIREIKLVDGTFPQEADVDLYVKIVVSQRTGGLQDQNVPRRLMLRLQKEGDGWVITDYDHMSPVGGPDVYSPGGNNRRPGVGR